MVGGNDDITEAKYMDEAPDYYDHEEARLALEAAVRDNALRRLVDTMERRMTEAKEANVGDTIECACCSKSITKTTYHKVFCSNAKTHGKNNCKDRYHNVLRYHTDPVFAARLDKYGNK